MDKPESLEDLLRLMVRYGRSPIALKRIRSHKVSRDEMADFWRLHQLEEAKVVDVRLMIPFVQYAYPQRAAIVEAICVQLQSRDIIDQDHDCSHLVDLVPEEPFPEWYVAAG